MPVTNIRGLVKIAAWLLVGASPMALAHNPLTSTGESQLAAICSSAVLAGFWFLYVLGSWRKPPARYLAICFHATTLLCVIAILGPLDEWAKTSSAAHMSQHMLLMVVIAPLWVISRPLPQIIAASGRVVAWIWRPMLYLTGFPMLTAYLQGAVIWFWHMPHFYMLAVENVWWHALEHLCFILAAGIFWWAILKGSRRNMHWAMFALLFTLMHTGFLGALLTFARAPWYGEARSLEDQQLAGLIMWVVGAIPYLLASLWIGLRWVKSWQGKMGKVSD